MEVCYKLEKEFEVFLEDKFPSMWKYVGTGKKIIAGKCPDFINKEKNKVIGLYGDYWHKGQNPQDRIDLFKKEGWNTLVIWENEIKRNFKKVEEKVQNFCGGICNG